MNRTRFGPVQSQHGSYEDSRMLQYKEIIFVELLIAINLTFVKRRKRCVSRKKNLSRERKKGFSKNAPIFIVRLMTKSRSSKILIKKFLIYNQISFHILQFDFILSNVHLSSRYILICKFETYEQSNISQRSKASKALFKLSSNYTNNFRL